jgi:heptosyltransferase-2
VNTILVVKHGALGDVVRTTFLLPALRDVFKGNVCIDWLTADAAVDLIRFNPNVDRILTDSTNCRTEYDWIISLDDEHEAVMAASLPRARRRSGLFWIENRYQYTDDLARWFDMGLRSRFGKERADLLKVENQASHTQIFAQGLGLTAVEPTFFNSPKREERIAKLLRAQLPPNARVVGINAGAGKRWPSKQIPEVTVTQLCERLCGEHGVDRILLLGDQESLPKGDAIPRGLDVHTPDTSSSPLELAAVIRCLDYLITTDSLALHLGIAQRISTLSVYAPTSAAEIETFGTGAKLVSSKPDYCSYRANADNSEFTAERILAVFRSHLTCRKLGVM